MLAYQATHEQVAAADTVDAIAGDADAEAADWPARFRAAWRSLRGLEKQPAADGADQLPSTAPALAADADEVGETLAAYTDSLHDHLVDHGDDEGDLRMFQ